MSEQIGPTTRYVSFSERRCGSCIYHESHMLVSGRDPQYEHRCMHDNANPEGFLTSYNFFGEKGREIGSNDITPDWCPILKRNQP